MRSPPPRFVSTPTTVLSIEGLGAADSATAAGAVDTATANSMILRKDIPPPFTPVHSARML
jgi:hypothetical protein